MSDEVIGGGNTGTATETEAPAAAETALPEGSPDESLAGGESATEAPPADGAPVDGAEPPPEEGTETPETETEAPAAPAPESIIAAARAGLEEADILGFQTDAELRRAIALVEKHKRVPEQENIPGAQDAEEAQPDVEIPDLDPKTNEPEAVAWSTAIKKAVQQQRQQVTRELKSLRQAVHEVRAREAVSWFENQLAGLDATESIYGKGPISELSDTAKRGNRERLMESWIKSGAQRTQAAVKAAHHGAFYTAIAKAKNAQTATHLRERKGQMTLPPAQRPKGTGLTGHDAVIANLKALAARDGVKLV
mgnify:CR=1 FL=1